MPYMEALGVVGRVTGDVGTAWSEEGDEATGIGGTLRGGLAFRIGDDWAVGVSVDVTGSRAQNRQRSFVTIGPVVEYRFVR
jgi:hypothetical protein